MRYSRLSFVIAAILGAFVIYCGQSSMNNLLDGGGLDGRASSRDGRSTGGDGFVRDARAQSNDCCTPQPYTFTKINEQTVGASSHAGAIDVSAYREIVVYLDSYPCSGIYVNFAPSADLTLMTTGTAITAMPKRVLGSFATILNNCDQSVHVGIYGIK